MIIAALILSVMTPTFVSAANDARAGTACTLQEFKIDRQEAIRAGEEFLPVLSKSSSKDRQPALTADQLKKPESICTLIGHDCGGKRRKILFLRYKEADGTPFAYIVLSVDGKRKYSTWNIGWTRTPSNILAERMRRLDCD